jgi:hypothetical protein
MTAQQLVLAHGLKTYTVTQTFYSSTNWTAPATTTKIDVLSGQGSGGSSDSSSVNWYGLAGIQGFPWCLPNSYGSLDWSTIWNYANEIKNCANQGGTPTCYYYRKYDITGIGPSNDNQVPSCGDHAWGYSGIFNSQRSDTIVGGSAYLSSYGNPPTSGLAQHFPFVNQGWEIYATFYYYGGPGGASSAFGYTFPGGGYSGGVGYGAPGPYTYNNVAVTPGQTYYIGVSNYVQITYSYKGP